MQGRLVPPTGSKIQCFPREQWSDEFAAAQAVPLDGIEWIYDAHGADVNPLATDSGLDSMRQLARYHGVGVRSVCADYFMDFPLLRVTDEQRNDRLSRLRWLIAQCGRIEIQRIVLPFVDASRIETVDEADFVVESLKQVLVSAEASALELHLEANLGPTEFAALLAKLDHPLVKVNYDAGNSAALGFDPHDEFKAYGSRVGSVHIKDRVRGGRTVPLGTGDVDFTGLRESLIGIAFRGEFVLQVARGQLGAEIAWARRNRQSVLRWWLSGVTPGSDGGLPAQSIARTKRRLTPAS
jgi:L-ribulose-5-phosphate 3-epimerase